MVSITLSVSEQLKTSLDHFSWVNWSAFAREESRKKEIFEEYIKTKKLSDKDWGFCDSIDWHPVDELPLKKEFVEKLKKAKKETPIRYKSVDNFFKKLK